IRFDRRDILVHAHARARVIMEGRDRPAQGYAWTVSAVPSSHPSPIRMRSVLGSRLSGRI
ncbi:MAG TPA: hypothetical protein VIE66_04620, partial [Methylocella sp.]